MNTIVYSLALFAAVGTGMAHESANEAQTATPMAVAGVAKEHDGAQAAIEQAVAQAPAANAVRATGEFVSAEDLVERRLNALNLTAGYDSKKKAIIQVGSASIKIEDPANDSGFLLAREQIANNAYLNAKADVIRAINTEFSATDRALVAAEFGEDETAKQFAAKKAQIEEKRAELSALIAKVDAAEAQVIEQVTLSDRFGSLLDGLIKKIDREYSPEALAAKKVSNAAGMKAVAAQLKERCTALIKEYKKLEEEAEHMPKDPVLSTSSDVKALSRMPLLGSSVLTQAESWDPEEKIYSVALAVVWSPRLQEDAMRIVSGDFATRPNKGKYSKLEWVGAQDFSSMIGPRRFTDNEGNNLWLFLHLCG